MKSADRRYLLRRVASFAALWFFACAFLVTSLAIPAPTRPTPIAAGTFPTIVGVAMVIAATGMVIGAGLAYLKARRPESAARDEAAETETPVGGISEEDTGAVGPSGEEVVHSPARLAIAIGAAFVYILLFFPLGYLVSTALFMVGMLIFFWRRLLWSVVLGIGLTIAIGLLFDLLGVRLPAGILALPL